MNKPATPTRKISEIQLSMLMFTSIMSTLTLFVPAITAEKARQSAWLAAGVVPSVIGITTLFLITRLAKLYPGQSIVQYVESITGKLLGKLIAFSYIAFFLLTNIVIVRELTEYITVMLLPGTPVFALSLIFVLAAVYVVPKGPETICRMAQFLMPLFYIVFMILITLTIPDWRLSELTPLLEGGVIPILKGSIVPSAWFGEIVVVAMFMPNVNKPQEMFLKGSITLLIIGGFVSVLSFVTLAVFGPDLSAILTFPVMSLIKYIKIGTVLQRLETYMVGFWIGTMFIKVVVFYYVSYEATVQSLKINRSKWLLFSLAIVHILGAVYLFPNTLEVPKFIEEVWVKLALLFEVGLIILLWLTAHIRNFIRRLTATKTPTS